MRLYMIPLCLIFAGCTPGLPEVDRVMSPAARNAPFPKLQPLDQLLASAEAGSTVTVETQTLAARVARLKARAATLQGRSVIDAAERLRLQRAGARNVTRLTQ